MTSRTSGERTTGERTTGEMVLPWWPAPAGRVPLTRDTILRAAIEVMDRDGLDALSMRAVAVVLGVTPPALYGHVRNKEQLLVLLFDAVLAQVELPESPSADWAEDLRRIARSWRATMLAHPEATRLSAVGMPLGPNLLRHVDAVLGVLRRAGLADAKAFFAATAFVDNFMSFSLFIDANNPIRQLERAGASSEAAAAAWEEMLDALPAASIPNVAALRSYFNLDDDRYTEMFERTLDLLIDGIGTWLSEGD